MERDPVWLAAAQSHGCDFWRAVETEGNPDGADAAIDVELQALKVEDTFDVFPSPRGKIDGADKRNAYLAPVRVTAEHELDARAGRMIEKFVGEVGRMAHQNDRLAGTISNGFGNGKVNVGTTFDRVVEARQPDAGRAALERRK